MIKKTSVDTIITLDLMQCKRKYWAVPIFRPLSNKLGCNLQNYHYSVVHSDVSVTQ
jgi:hypothetical protein